MKYELFEKNLPKDFWAITPPPSDDLWQQAVDEHFHLLELPSAPAKLEELIPYVLSEDAYGNQVWELSRVKKLYYMLKPFIPRYVIRLMRRLYHTGGSTPWYIDERYARFMWNVLQYVVDHSDASSQQFKSIWPQNKQFAFALTHDIEEASGMALVREMADIDEKYGFRSAFFFVPERYKLDFDVIAELKERGFEVGIHGLKHDGRLFSSKRVFNDRVKQINHYIEELGAVGFSAPFTHRNALWMQDLNVKYDRSFFDIDLYEPMPGGVLTIWPYQLGKFIELPYTLLQDFTLTQIMKETTPDIWLQKLEFIQQYQGMALLNAHPDYLAYETTRKVYIEFLEAVSQRDDYWHALPSDIASWWRTRQNQNISSQYIEIDQLEKLVQQRIG